MDDPATSELGNQAESLGVPLGSEQVRQLLVYERLLEDRGPELGLISEADLRRIRERHVLDCLRAVLAIGAEDVVAMDLGSGGGLPGIPVAIAVPGLRVVLVESRRVRASFLELAVERVGLQNADVHVGRIEELSEAADVCFARALAPPAASWALAEPHLKPAGRLVYFAGARTSAGPNALDPPPGTRLIRILNAPTLASAGVLAIIGRP